MSSTFAYSLLIGAIIAVAYVSAGSLTVPTGAPDVTTQGTLLRADWSMGCVNHPDLSSPLVGPNQCDPARDAGTAWYCRIESDGSPGIAAQFCDTTSGGCSCNANNGGRNDYACPGFPASQPCESCVLFCSPSCTFGHECVASSAGLCVSGNCVCRDHLCTGTRNVGSCSIPPSEPDCGIVTGTRTFEERRCVSGSCVWRSSSESCTVNRGDCGGPDPDPEPEHECLRNSDCGECELCSQGSVPWSCQTIWTCEPEEEPPEDGGGGGGGGGTPIIIIDQP